MDTPPTFIKVEETLFCEIYNQLNDSLEYMNDALSDHDNSLGRTTRKNRAYAAVIENDIRTAKRLISELESSLPYNYNQQNQ